MPTANRVLVIGLDGATWDVLDPWMRDGTLPCLAQLRRHGSWGPLRSSIPPITAAAWSTFMTGKRPGKHGVYHFINLFDNNGAGDDEPELVSARSIRSPALWDAIGHHDQRVVLVNIPLTYPPRPVNGVMVTGLLTPSSASVFTYPPQLSAQITDYQIDLDRFMDKTPHVDAFDAASTAPSLALVEEFRAMEEKRARVSLSLMASQPWEFFMVVFTGTDRMGHYLWPYHRPAPPQAEIAATNTDDEQIQRAVRDFYIRLDQIVGELVAQAGEDTTVIVMSDHGMGPVETRRFHCNNWLRRQGWLVAKSHGGALGGPDAWLKRLGIPRDKLGRLIHSIPGLAASRVVRQASGSRSDAVDTERSAAYCIPIFYNITGIRVQHVEKEALCRAITNGLEAIVDAETGRPVVRQVLRAHDYYDGPHAENIPDLIVITDPDYGCSYHLSHYSAVATRRPTASGPAKHRDQGILIVSGPGAARQAQPLPNLSIEDVAPTALYLMGLPVSADMDGRVLTEALDPALLATQPIACESPTGFWPSQSAATFDDTAMSDEDEELIRGRLRALGYFE